MSMYYTFTNFLGEQYIRKEDGSMFPLSEENLDYKAYLAWVAEGNTAEEYVQP